MINRGTQTNVPLVSETQNSAGSVRPVCSGPALNRPEAVLWLHAVCALHAAYSLTVVRRRDTEAIKTWLYFFFIKLKTSPDPQRQNDGVRSVFWQRSGGRRVCSAAWREVMMLFAFPLSSQHGWMHTAHTLHHLHPPPPPPPSSSCRRTSSHLQDVTDGDEQTVVLCSFSGRLSSNLR